MKMRFFSKNLMALAVGAALAAGGLAAWAQDATGLAGGGSGWPAGAPLGSPAGQVYKLVSSGVDPDVVMHFIANSPSPFNLQADEIIALTDAGASPDIIKAMYERDQSLPADTGAAAGAAASPAPGTVAEVPPASSALAVAPAPTEPLDVEAVVPALAPYGTWVQVAGYGRCWRPNVVVYDASWRPYADRGRWIYTDYGWFWASDYSWGLTFQYGRWFNAPGFGWCWWPDRVWGPSWVTWRMSSGFYGWAPLPPFAVFTPGAGFFYRGNSVAVGFDFGLSAASFTFVPAGRFGHANLRSYRLPPTQVVNIFNQTTVINNFGSNNRTVVNNGISVTTISQAQNRPIQPVPVRTVARPGGAARMAAPVRQTGSGPANTQQRINTPPQNNVINIPQRGSPGGSPANRPATQPAPSAPRRVSPSNNDNPGAPAPASGGYPQPQRPAVNPAPASRPGASTSITPSAPPRLVNPREATTVPPTPPQRFEPVRSAPPVSAPAAPAAPAPRPAASSTPPPAQHSGGQQPANRNH